jgi:hypothetical protein
MIKDANYSLIKGLSALMPDTNELETDSLIPKQVSLRKDSSVGALPKSAQYEKSKPT